MSGERVFFCYNAADRTAVEWIALQARQRGIDAWLDDWDLVGGDPYLPQILNGLRMSSAVVVALGEKGAGRWQTLEIERALNSHKRVIPVLLGDVEVPRDHFLADRHAIRFPTPENPDSLRRLFLAIEGRPPGPPRAELPAPAAASPYRPLRPFDVEDSRFFCGRSPERKRALDKLDAGGETRFAAILGASGSGKSSLARAGVVAALREEGWISLILEPGPDPLGALARAVKGITADAAVSTHTLVEAFRNDEFTLQRALAELPRPVVILADQFETLFTQCRNPQDQAAFVRNLLCAARDRERRAAVLITLRADFLDSCADPNLPGLGALIENSQILLGRMGRENLREVIVEPARRLAHEVEPALVRILLGEAVSQANPLPLLQLFLHRLWEDKGGSRRLTLPVQEGRAETESYLEQAIDKHAEDAFRSLSEGQAELARVLFLQLVKPVDEERFVRRTMPLDELVPGQPPETAGLWRDLVNRLSDWRLLSLSYQRPAGVQVDVSHEAILTGWKRLHNWLGEARELLLWKRRLWDRMREWEESREARGALLMGLVLQEAEIWLRKEPREITRNEQRYILASRRNRTVSRLGVAAVIVVAVALSSGAWWWSRREARFQSIVGQARTLVDAREPLALVLALYAAERKPETREIELLQQAAQANSLPVIEAPPGETDGWAGVAVSPDGESFAAADRAGALSVWQVPTGMRKASYPIPAGNSVRLTWGPSGLTAAIASAGKLHIWRQQQLRSLDLPAPAAMVGVAEASGAAIVDAQNRVWWRQDGAGWNTVGTLPEPARQLNLSRDGAALGVLSEDGKAYLWKHGAPSPLTIERSGEAIGGLFFFGDDRRPAIVTLGGRLTLLSPDAGEPAAHFQMPGQRVLLGAVAASGRRVAAWNSGNSLCAWEAESGSRIQAFSRLEDEARLDLLLLDDEGRTLFTVDASGAVRFYPLEPDALHKQAWRLLEAIRRDRLLGCFEILGSASCSKYLDAARK